MADLPYKRVLLKLSGEMLVGDQSMGIQPDIIGRFADEIKEIHGTGVQIAIVIGGGNIFRGLAGASRGMDRAHADYMGMLATVINGLALQDAMETRDVHTRVMSAITVNEICEPYIRRKAIRHLEKGRVGIFAGGTGNPYVTTDTAAALRAAEIHADVILKATKVDGVFDRDPAKYDDAVMYKRLSYMQILERGLTIMDSTAVTLCMDNNLPIVVFNMTVEGNIRRVIEGADIGTRICTA